MRKHHERLNKIYLLILQCDNVIEWEQRINGATSLSSKFRAIRERLYKMYASQLAKMAGQIITHELRTAQPLQPHY